MDSVISCILLQVVHQSSFLIKLTGQLPEIVTLFNEVSNYEHMVSNKSSLSRRCFGNMTVNDRNADNHWYKICENPNKGTRYHTEYTCWFKARDNKF